MGDDKNFERQRLKLIMSLSTVAEAMRNCATIAEQFADMVQEGGHPDASHIAAMIHGASEQNGIPPAKAGRKRKADEDAEPTKRTRKPKDPNAPKRPASSYILYQNEIRKELREKHPGVTNSELLNIIAKQWAEMSDADKAVYNNAVASAKEQYSQEKKAYDSRSPEEVEAANAAAAAALAAKKATPRSRAVKAVQPAATIPAPKITTPDSSSEEDDSEEEDAGEDEKEKEKEKTKPKLIESESDEEDDDEDSESEDEEEDIKPPAKKSKTTKVVALAPKEKRKRATKA